MAPTLLYTVCLIAAFGLYLHVRAGRGADDVRTRGLRAAGALIGLAAAGYLVTGIGQAIGGTASSPGFFYLAFSLMAVVSAVQMIATSRPVYSALHFVLVVLASAGLFLLLEAEFMAFALIIIYAGAILITYMFVLMLAQQSPDADHPSGQPDYDLRPREPAAGAIVGFILLALLGRMILDGTTGLPPGPTDEERRAASWRELRDMPARITEYAADSVDGSFELVMVPSAATIGTGEVLRPLLRVEDEGRRAVVTVTLADGTQQDVILPEDARPENVQRVGLGLIAEFPVSLELAGVILLMAMLGAVVLARRQIELTEDEKREAAGMERLAYPEEPMAGPDAGAAGGNGGNGGGGGTRGNGP